MAEIRRHVPTLLFGGATTLLGALFLTAMAWGSGFQVGAAVFLICVAALTWVWRLRRQSARGRNRLHELAAELGFGERGMRGDDRWG